jgi:hypothetical protein
LDGELAQDRRDMVLDRPPGKDEPVGDLAVPEVLRDQGEYFELSRGQVRWVAAGGRLRTARKPSRSLLAKAASDERGRGLRAHALQLAERVPKFVLSSGLRPRYCCLVPTAEVGPEPGGIRPRALKLQPVRLRS